MKKRSETTRAENLYAYGIESAMGSPSPAPAISTGVGTESAGSVWLHSRTAKLGNLLRIAFSVLVDVAGGATLDDLDDDELVERIRTGETALYHTLMRRHHQRLYRIARVILRNPEEAEDVVQEAYVRAYRHLSQFAGTAKFSTWLTKIAVHEALARLRKRSRITAADPVRDTEKASGMESLESADSEP
jgi:Sigma-70 region 2